MLVLLQVLQSVRGTAEVEIELMEIKRAADKAKASRGGLVLFRRRRHLPQLLWCIALPIMQQYTGINAFMFYGECFCKTANLALLPHMLACCYLYSCHALRRQS